MDQPLSVMRGLKVEIDSFRVVITYLNHKIKLILKKIKWFKYKIASIIKIFFPNKKLISSYHVKFKPQKDNFKINKLLQKVQPK